MGRVGRWGFGRLCAGLALAVAMLVSATGAASAEAGSALPQDVRVTDLQDTEFTVAWDGAPDATYYQAKLFRPGASSHFTSLIRHEPAPATFTNLAWGSRYTVVVTAVYDEFTDHRRYADSAPIDVTTALPEHCDFPGAPREMGAVFDELGRVETIAWRASAEGCETLTYRLHAQGVGSLWSSDLPAEGYQAHLHHLLFVQRVLEPGQTYTFFATATDSRGNVSPPSEPLTLTMPTELPELPLNPPSDLRVTLDSSGLAEQLVWNPATGGSGLYTYHVNFRYGSEQAFDAFATTRHASFAVAQLMTDLRACRPTDHPSSMLIFRVSAEAGPSAPATNEVALCFP